MCVKYNIAMVYAERYLETKIKEIVSMLNNNSLLLTDSQARSIIMDILDCYRNDLFELRKEDTVERRED